MITIMALALAASSTPIQTTNLSIPADHKPCVASWVSAADAAKLVRKLRREGYAVTVSTKAKPVPVVVAEGIQPNKPSLMRGYVAKSGC